jgi:hypothetical protein
VPKSSPIAAPERRGERRHSTAKYGKGGNTARCRLKVPTKVSDSVRASQVNLKLEVFHEEQSFRADLPHDQDFYDQQAEKEQVLLFADASCLKGRGIYEDGEHSSGTA